MYMRGAGRGVKIMREKTMSRSVEGLVYLEGDHVLKLIEYGRAPRLPTLELRNDSHIGYISFSFRTCKKKKTVEHLHTYVQYINNRLFRNDFSYTIAHFYKCSPQHT